jgi:3-(3-hydroxy-phenyl)propionate hydroxylase
VTEFSQTADKVVVTAKTPGGAEKLEANWLVGADGGRSMVRKCMGVAFDGYTWPERFLVASTTYDYEPHGYRLNTYVADPENWNAMFKMPGDGPMGLWRVLFPVRPDEDEAAALSAENVERLMQGFQRKAGRYQIENQNLYKVHQRVAADFRVGRALLAGDAAHVNNPIGAFGLNGGIHDAINLAEKLGRVCRGAASPALLDLYVRQRRTVNLEYVQEYSIRNLQRLTARTEAERRKNFDELRQAASTVEGARNFLLISSMIASVQRAAAIT